MVHLKTFVPSGIEVIVVFGSNEFVITPPPEINDQVPTPTVGGLPAMVTEPVLMQIVCVGPASAKLGI